MNVRQFVNRNPAVVTVLVLLLIGICGWVIWSQTAAMSAGKPPKAAFFTTDDGKTWFTDDVALIAPFDKEGKLAVRAHLVRCGDDGEPVVAFLERYTTKGKEVTERYRAEQKAKPGVPPASLGEMASLGVNATEVKKPGDEKWIPKGQALQMMQFQCQGGSIGIPVIP